MSKELKALNRIKDFMSANAHHWKQDVGMIETALKRLEKIDDLIEDCNFDNLDTGLQFFNLICDLRRRDKKKLKALEIIKKRIKLGGLNEDTTNTYYPYPECDFLHKQLTKEEYDLLKEVLK